MAPTELGEWFRDPIVTVKVGPKQMKFGVHRDLLCGCSTYFKAALEGPYTEAQERTIELAEESAAAFELFVAWLYRRSITDQDTVYSIEDSGRDYNYEDLWHLFVFAELRGIPDLLPAVWAAIQEGAFHDFEEGREKDTAHYIYQNTLDTSDIRKKFVKIFTEDHSSREIFAEANEGDWPERFLLDLLRDCYSTCHLS